VIKDMAKQQEFHLKNDEVWVKKNPSLSAGID